MLAEQLAFHWDSHVRPRLSGLTDEEYRWEPVPGWNLRPAGDAPPAGARSVGDGPVTADFAPIGLFAEAGGALSPFTTIAWRMAHVATLFAEHNATQFGGQPFTHDGFGYTLVADEAIAQLDEQIRWWLAGVRALTPTELDQPWAPGQPPFGDEPRFSLVLHVHREAIHHLAEVCLLRDLYAHQRGG